MTETVSQAAREGWIIMPCPICNVGKTERCRDTLGKPHPSMHPERRVWSTFTRSGEREPAPSSERIDVAARAAYAAYCTTDPVDAEKQPDWGRDGYKAEAGVWQAVAAAVLSSTTQEPALDLHTLEEAAKAVEAHRYEDDFLNTCTIRRAHKRDLATAIRALKGAQ